MCEKDFSFSNTYVRKMSLSRTSYTHVSETHVRDLSKHLCEILPKNLCEIFQKNIPKKWGRDITQEIFQKRSLFLKHMCEKDFCFSHILLAHVRDTCAKSFKKSAWDPSKNLCEISQKNLLCEKEFSRKRSFKMDLSHTCVRKISLSHTFCSHMSDIHVRDLSKHLCEIFQQNLGCEKEFPRKRSVSICTHRDLWVYVHICVLVHINRIATCSHMSAIQGGEDP